jgi:two-component system sensor histidine kinase KdpD
MIRWTASILALAGIVLVYRRFLHVNPTTVALTLLLFILILAAQWSLRYAVVTSLLATFCYNYYFLPPLGTLTVSDPQNWLALFTFLSTAVIGSRLSQRARDEAEEARCRQRELETLFSLSREMLATENVAELVATIPRAIIGTTRARIAVIYLIEDDRMYQAGTEPVADVERPHLRQQALQINAVEKTGEELRVPLKVGVKPRGLLLVRGVTLSTGAMEAIGSLISVSLDRARALEDIAHREATKESERLRSLMIDSITHELRTPLTSIKGAASILLSNQIGKEEDRRELLTIIDEESDRINKLVSQAVEMAQLDARQVHMSLERIDIEEVFQSAQKDCAWVYERHPVELRLQEKAPIVADLEFMKKVVCNLLENAGKYSKDQSPIVVTTMIESGFLVTSVADKGIGIDPNEQGLIFDRFYRAPIHNQRISGTGMGLSISKAIVEAHGGTMQVVSRPGEGSVFSFSIPLAPAS